MKNNELPEASIPDSKESLEQDLNHEVAEDLQVLAQAVDKFDKLAEKAKTPEAKTKTESLRSRIFKKSKDFLDLSLTATLCSILAMAIDFYATRNTIEKKRDRAGNIEYFHPDKETTRILNMLSGRERGMSSSELHNLIWKIEEECGSPNVRFQTTGPSIAGIELDRNTIRPYFNPLSNTAYIPVPSFRELDRKDFGKLLAELSHGKQFNDSPLGFYVKFGASILRILGEGGLNAEKLSEAQDKEYNILNSLENEAHSIIEPKLKEKYKDIAQGN